MIQYELLACRNRRWEVDRLLDTRKRAVEEARMLVERDPLVSVVRVIMLENRKNGVAERPVCTVAASAHRKLGPANAWRGTETPHAARSSKLGIPTQRKKRAGELLLMAAVIAVAAAMLSYGMMLPKQPWAFNLPDAQKPHMIRDIFTGTYSQAQQ